jgi:hypothetical protein
VWHLWVTSSGRGRSPGLFLFGELLQCHLLPVAPDFSCSGPVFRGWGPSPSHWEKRAFFSFPPLTQARLPGTR